MAATAFEVPEPEGLLRVVFAGASTVQGFPHPRRLSAARVFQEMLSDATGRPVQVVNLGVTSLASFAVVRIVEHAVELDPNVIVVYTGHNEFYGIYGIGGSNRLHYELMDWRLPLALRRLVDSLRGTRVSSAALLETLSRKGEVDSDDPRRVQAARSLRANLEDLADLGEQHGIPIVLCTLAANDAGFAPAGSSSPPIDGEAMTAWMAHVSRAERLRTVPKAHREMIAHLDSAASLSDDHAWPTFLRGVALHNAGSNDEASHHFLRARELDTLPWRAPARHNREIREVAAARDAVDLADV
ncbi:uncharacterized protein METZ01_LOCUS377469, partial [marine metagenome]